MNKAKSDLDQENHISSLIVLCRPAAFEAISTWLEENPQTELSGSDPSGKLVVVLETKNESGILEVIDQLQALEGVINASLVYHQIE